MLRRKHSVATTPPATAGPVEVNEYTSLDLTTKNALYTLKAPRLGQAMRLSRNPERHGDNYSAISQIEPQHLDALIGLLTVARDKINGFRPS